MVTGDNLLTARAIAMECGIIEPENYDSLVMNGVDFIKIVGGSKFSNLKSSAKAATQKTVIVL
jgi:magnesium-transporting ATPase (P-type)